MRDASSPPRERTARLVRQTYEALDSFFRLEAASGIILMAAAGLALVLANTGAQELYRTVFHTRYELEFGGWSFGRSFAWIINDVLMSVFFFVVGLEIRGEVEHGELSDLRRASLPVGAALGGVALPAALYLLSSGGAAPSGWGVPMATDIAFALGVLTLLGRRVPAALRVLLLAVAIIDDLVAILVIAIFYSSNLHWLSLALAALALVAILVMQRWRVTSKLAYLPPALIVWLGVYNAGIHPTIAGVAVGLLTPTRHLRPRPDDSDPPAKALLHGLHPWVAFGIMPLFALANAGVTLAGVKLDATTWGIAFGIVVGLVVGKPAGVLLGVGVLHLLNLAVLPDGVGKRHVLLLGLVAGVGFTMALFIAQLAFVREEQLGAAKLGVLSASAIAALLTLLVGRFAGSARRQN